MQEAVLWDDFTFWGKCSEKLPNNVRQRFSSCPAAEPVAPAAPSFSCTCVSLRLGVGAFIRFPSQSVHFRLFSAGLGLLVPAAAGQSSGSPLPLCCPWLAHRCRTLISSRGCRSRAREGTRRGTPEVSEPAQSRGQRIGWV